MNETIDALACCTVCGTGYDEHPWGPAGDDPSFNICQRCGVEWGRQDATPEGVLAHRAAWLERGGIAVDAMAPEDGLTAQQRIDRLVTALAALDEMGADALIAA